MELNLLNKNQTDVKGREDRSQKEGESSGAVAQIFAEDGGRRSVVSRRSRGGSLSDVSFASVSDAESRLSACSVQLEPLPSRFWTKEVVVYGGKRRRDKGSHSDSASSDEASAADPKVRVAKRGRGRPPSTGKYVGLAKAQADLNALRREEAQKKAEEEIAARVASHKAARKVAPPEPTVDSGLVCDLKKQVDDAVDMIVSVATRSGNLKGTFIKALKESVTSIKGAVSELAATTITEQTKKLQEDNARLRAEMSELRKVIMEMKTRRTESEDRVQQPSQPQDELIRSIMLQVGGMVNARIEGLQERLLPEKRHRPPLSSDKRKEAPTPKTAPEAEQSVPQPPLSKTKKRRQKKSQAAAEAAAATSSKTAEQKGPSAPEKPKETWATVTKRGKTAKPQEKPASSKQGKAAEKPRPKKVKLRPPRTAAIVITLQPGAQEKGATYSKVIAEAKAKVDLSTCGIAASNLRFRKAATGARILEVAAGDTSGEKADSLADKLREVFGDEEVARVSRPVKCTGLRITGLDDSVTKEEVADAVSQQGSCPKEAVKVGEIRQSYQGTGTTLISCPVAAAKKLGAENRLLVGWVSAKVEILQPKPVRCYRCLESGHVRAQCSSETDRSDECYRCGEPGHKSATCSATPKCSLCSAANRPSAHRLGGKSCAPPKTNKKAKGAKNSTAEPSSSGTSSQQEGMRVEMETG